MISIEKYDIERIEEECKNWRSAAGVHAGPESTNSTLHDRDYSVECKTKWKIAIVKGIHIWWCSAHVQPEFMCSGDRSKQYLLNVMEAIILTDKTKDYEYPGYARDEDKVNAKGEAPAAFQRWLAPREIAENYKKKLSGNYNHVFK